MNKAGWSSIMVAAMLLAVGVIAEAQQPGKVYRVGVLTNVPPTAPEVGRLWGAFQQGLREHGWIEGQNIIIEFRWTEGQVERLPSLAAELVGLKIDLLVTVSTLGARAAKQATGVIPIVMVYVGDPVEEGLVASLARPGNNVTGLTFIVGPEVVGKYLELLKEAVPKISRVAVLFHQATPRIFLKEAQAAAQALIVKLQLLEVRGPNDLEGAFAAMTKGSVNGLLVVPHPFTFAQARVIADLAAKRRLPAVYGFSESVEAGGLMAYEANAPDMFRRAATYVDKILKGTKPADLPVERPTKFELVINLKAAKQIGLTIPPNVLARADKVIR
jgi:putative tryptophan/tyrosine transport system substrate-binding protein